jgi:hypothetical protein
MDGRLSQKDGCLSRGLGGSVKGRKVNVDGWLFKYCTVKGWVAKLTDGWLRRGLGDSVRGMVC